MPSLLPFIQRFVSHTTSHFVPASIFIHAPHNAELVLPLLQLVLAKKLALAPRSSPPSIQDLLPKIAVVDLEEVHTTRTAFDLALNTLSAWSKEGHPGVWNEAEGKVENWERRTEGLEAVRERKRFRGKGGVAGKRKKLRREEESDDDELVVEQPEEEEDDDDDEEEERWTLSWNRHTPLSKERIAPIRDTLEYLHEGLVVISTLGTSNDAGGEVLLGPFDSGEPRPERRWLIFDHAEGLSDLAAPGNAGGAPKETGMGMTFLSSVHRIAELVSWRSHWASEQVADDWILTVQRSRYFNHHLSTRLGESSRSDGRTCCSSPAGLPHSQRTRFVSSPASFASLDPFSQQILSKS